MGRPPGSGGSLPGAASLLRCVSALTPCRSRTAAQQPNSEDKTPRERPGHAGEGTTQALGLSASVMRDPSLPINPHCLKQTPRKHWAVKVLEKLTSTLREHLCPSCAPPAHPDLPCLRAFPLISGSGGGQGNDVVKLGGRGGWSSSFPLGWAHIGRGLGLSVAWVWAWPCFG